MVEVWSSQTATDLTTAVCELAGFSLDGAAASRALGERYGGVDRDDLSTAEWGVTALCSASFRQT